MRTERKQTRNDREKEMRSGREKNAMAVNKIAERCGVDI
jgi:hypothetical protein